jgi:hypothetical protein
MPDNAITTDEILNFITGKLKPAIDIADSDINFTTDQILEQLYLHFGEMSITKEQLVHGLKLSGYHYDTLPGELQLVWVFKQV